jgi:beta-glucosidase/6-phospho-beta-glucosidase/beta-galactosidase
LLRCLQISYYRFSISWPRIFPNGTGAVSQGGIAYYHRLIDALKAANIEPMVTLYHWDFPEALYQQGGWLNDSAVEWFDEYVRKCYQEYGPKVN